MPCTCPSCKGSLVTRYTRRKHSRLFSDIEVVRKYSGDGNDKEPSSLTFTHAHPTAIDETIDISIAEQDETEPLSLDSPDASPSRFYATADEKVIFYVLAILCNPCRRLL